MKTAAIYCRVSTQGQGKGYSLGTQVQQCHDYALSKGYTVIDEHVFQDMASGANLERPALDKLLDLASTGAIQHVVVLELDRLSREPAHHYILEQDFKKYGAPVEFVNSHFDDSPEGDLQKAIMQAISKFEKTNTRRRSTRNMRARIERGYPTVGAMAPYGYKYIPDPRQGRLETAEDEARVVRMIFEWYVQGDETGRRLGSAAIARRLSEMNIPTRYDTAGREKGLRRRGAWSVSTIKKLLHNETYTGTWHYRKNVRTSKTTTKLRDRTDWMGVVVPAIIEPDLFAAVRVQAQHNKVQCKRAVKYGYLLQRRLSCPECGRLFMCEADTRRANYPRFYYRCDGQRSANSHGYDRATCSRSLRADVWDEWVWQRLVAILKHPDLILAEARARADEVETEGDRLRQRIGTLEGGIGQCDRKRAELIEWGLDAALADTLPKEVLQAKARTLTDEIAGYEFELANLQRQLTILTGGAPDEEAIKQTCAELARGIDLFEPADRRGVIELLDIKATAYRGATPTEDEIVLSGMIPAISVSANGRDDANIDTIVDLTR